MKYNPFDLVRGLMQKDNPFRELTSAERQKRKENEIAIKEGIKKMSYLCADILVDQRYKEFADLFRDIEKRVIDAMVDLEEVDRDKFFLRMKELQHRLRDFRNILRMPNDFITRAEEIKRTEVK